MFEALDRGAVSVNVLCTYMPYGLPVSLVKKCDFLALFIDF